jgi:hypothetical protein
VNLSAVGLRSPARSNRQERIPLRIDDVSAASREDLLEQPAVLAAEVSVAIPEPTNEIRRALDVGEEECHRPPRGLEGMPFTTAGMIAWGVLYHGGELRSSGSGSQAGVWALGGGAAAVG